MPGHALRTRTGPPPPATSFVLSLVAALAAAQPAAAVLRHYGVHWATIAEFNTASPSPDKEPPKKDGSTPTSVAIVDDDDGGFPVLKRIILLTEKDTTVAVPGLTGGFIFLGIHSEQGPRRGLAFTGTGSTGTTIAWGLVTGWTVTGGFWCHSSPSYICAYAGGQSLATTDPLFASPFYDLGTWTFHGTGFTAVPFVQQVAPPSSMSVGNVQFHLRGRLQGGFVPALSVLGGALLGASLLLGGAVLSGRGRRAARRP